MADLKRNVKDSVFTFLFSQPEYTRQLYLTLHPEDKDILEDEVKIVTLENILATGQYNDLGIQVRDKLILLVEAQSTFSSNIVLRMLMYLASTYKEFVEEHKLSLYSPKKVSIPRPELYMVYSGSRDDVPEVLHLSELYEGTGSVEVEVKVLRNDGSGDILDQYIRFCEIVDEQVKLYGRTQQAIDTTIQQCLAQGILAPFLGSRKKEVLTIMTTLFDQEKVLEIEKYNIAKEARQEERENGIRAAVAMMQGLSANKDVIVQKLIEQYGFPLPIAEEKVNRYWKQ